MSGEDGGRHCKSLLNTWILQVQHTVRFQQQYFIWVIHMSAHLINQIRTCSCPDNVFFSVSVGGFMVSSLAHSFPAHFYSLKFLASVTALLDFLICPGFSCPSGISLMVFYVGEYISHW